MISPFGLVLWALFLAGALPKPARLWLEERVPLWDERWSSVVSAVLEIVLGYGLLRSLLIETGIEDAPPSNALGMGAIGGFFAGEGVVRLALSSQGEGVASLPLYLAWRGLTALRGRSA